MKPHELRPDHVNRFVRLTVSGHLFDGYLGPFNHEIRWVSESSIANPFESHHVGVIETHLTLIAPDDGEHVEWYLFSTDEADITLED